MAPNKKMFRVVYFNSPQSLWLGGQAGRGGGTERGTGPHKWQAGMHTHIHAVPCMSSGPEVGDPRFI